MSNDTAQKVEHSIPIGRRIGEIMEEKGAAFSIRALSSRLEINRETLRLIISGERIITPSELKKIAVALNYPVQRIKQEDIAKDLLELQRLLESCSNNNRALSIADHLSSVAIGISERYEALDNLGRAFFNQKNYKEALRAWLEAHEYAKRLEEKYGDCDSLYSNIKKLIILYTQIKDNASLSRILESIESRFDSNPEQAGAIFYSKAMSLYSMGDLSGCRTFLIRSLECYIQTELPNLIGKAQINVGYIEFKLKNYLEAKNYLNDAISNLNHDGSYRLIAIKELAKTYIKLKQGHEVEEIVLFSLQQAQNMECYDLAAKFCLLLSIIKNEVIVAERALEIKGISPSVFRIICGHLMKYYASIDDSDNLLRYYKMAEGMSINTSDTLDEEDF